MTDFLFGMPLALEFRPHALASSTIEDTELFTADSAELGTYRFRVRRLRRFIGGNWRYYLVCEDGRPLNTGLTYEGALCCVRSRLNPAYRPVEQE